MVVAVRHTPLTATESPGDDLARERRPRRAAARRRPVCSTDAHLTEIHDQAGEHALTTPSCGRGSGRPRRCARSRATARASRRRCARRPRPRAGRGRSSRRGRPGAMKSAISSTSPASRKAPARCGPPSSSSEVMPAAPSWSSAERTRAGSFSPVATIDLGAGDLERVRRGARRGARDDDGQRHARRAADELGVERAAAPRSRRRRGAAAGRRRPGSSMRAVSCGSSASAVPMPTTTASRSPRQQVAREPARTRRRSTWSRRCAWRPCRRASSPT